MIIMTMIIYYNHIHYMCYGYRRAVSKMDMSGCLIIKMLIENQRDQ